MNRHNGRNWAAATLTDELTAILAYASEFEIFPKLFGIQIVGAGIDVDELRTSPGLRNRFCGRDECIRNGYDHVAGFYSRSHQGKAECVCPAPDPHGILRTAEFRESFFELIDHRTTDEAGGSQRLLEYRGQFFLQLQMRRDQIQERDICIHFEASTVSI